MPLTPEEQKELEALQADPRLTADLPDQQLRHDQDLLPQALALQPGTTHPEGDEAAAAEWKRDPQGTARGTVFAYEPPLTTVKQALMKDPQLATSLMPDHYAEIPLSQEEIAGLSADSPLYQAYADKQWRDTAEVAVKNGKTAYRYSRAPWLHGDPNVSALSTLGMKAKGAALPLLQGVESFIMGVDNALTLGAGGRMIESNAKKGPNVGQQMDGADMSGPLGALVGGDIAKSAAGEPADEIKGAGTGSREELMSEHPALSVGGQILATLAPWSAANRAYGIATGVVKPLAGAAPGIVRGIATAAAGGALGGALEQGGREAVNSGFSAAESGQAPQIEPGAGDRMKVAAALGGGFGAVGEALGQAAQVVANWIRGGSRYHGAPAEFEAAGGSFSPTKGPVAPPEMQSVVDQAKASDVEPVDLAAKGLAPHVERSVQERVSGTIDRVRQENRPFFDSEEGQQRLPATDTQATALKILRSKYAPSDKGKLQVIGDNHRSAAKVRALFNNEVGDVSLKPVPGAQEMSIKEAETFLSASNKQKVLARAGIKKPPPEASGGAREVDLGGGGPTPDLEAPPARSPDAEAPARDLFAQHSPAMQKRIDDTLSALSGAKEPMSKKQIGDKVFGGRVAEWEINQLVKQGKVREIPPGEHKPGWQIDRRYEVVQGGGAEAPTVPPKGKAARAAGKAPPPEPTREADTVRMMDGPHKVMEETNLYAKARKADNHRAAALKDELLPDDEEPLKQALGRKGITKVYVVPRRYTAEDHESLKESLLHLSKDPNTPAQREAKDLYVATLRDRDARPMNGQPGGWSKYQREHEAQISAAKGERDLATTDGSAFHPLVNYASRREGQLPLAEAVRASAGRVGARPELDRLRGIGLLEQLQGLSSGAAPGRMPFGPTAAFDAAAIRGYPVLKQLGGISSPIRGGRGGVGGSMVNLVGTSLDDQKDNSR